MNKPLVPRNVAEAIERLRSNPAPLSNEIILRIASWRAPSAFDGQSADAIRSIPFDTLLAVLVNGYEVEKSPHEQIRARYEYYKGKLELRLTLYEDEYSIGIRGMRDIEFVLNTLGIEISGVNAPEGVNA